MPTLTFKQLADHPDVFPSAGVNYTDHGYVRYYIAEDYMVYYNGDPVEHIEHDEGSDIITIEVDSGPYEVKDSFNLTVYKLQRCSL